jgi:mRNA-degrading endonuclease toxin of MazEF toxin-antitoxin module
VFAHVGDIWWSHVGVNLGSEICGKNQPYERPVLVLHAFTNTLLLIAPLTTKNKNTNNHVKIIFRKTTSFAMLEHVKTISTKRLSRRMGRLDKDIFRKVCVKYKEII